MQVFRQIFIECEYQCLDDLNNVSLVIDCGANVGFSSAYFLTRFPDARAIAIEPDARNFEALKRNLAGFGNRVECIHAAVWSHKVDLRFDESTIERGHEWGIRVREAKADETPSVSAIDIGSLLAASQQERISILKMDIEGAEAVVFASNCLDWIDRTDVIVIELHGKTGLGDADEAFFNAIDGRGFSVSKSGELTVCRRTASQGHQTSCNAITQ